MSGSIEDGPPDEMVVEVEVVVDRSVNGGEAFFSLTKQRCDAAIAISAILPGQFDHGGDETLLVFPASGNMTLCQTVLTEHATGTALRDAKTVAQSSR